MNHFSIQYHKRKDKFDKVIRDQTLEKDIKSYLYIKHL